MAPTSGTSKTFGHAARHARDQTAGKAEARSESGRHVVAITIAFSAGPKIPKAGGFLQQRYLITVAVKLMG
jgi:hypothetical protein